MTAPAPSTISSAAMNSEARTVRIAAALKPDPDTERDADIAGAFARLPREARRLAEFPLIDDADIGREFPAELVAQAQAGIDVGKTGADQPCRIGLTVDIELHLRLQDEALREQNVVGGLELGGEMALAADKASDLEVEEVRGKALNAERRPIPRRS